MKNYHCNTDNVPSNNAVLSLNNAINQGQTSSITESCINELAEIKQCNQRFDSLENQLNDLCIIADKFGLHHASHFIKNYCKFKIK